MVTEYAIGFLSAFAAISNPIGKLPFWEHICKQESAGVRTRLAGMYIGTSLILFLLLFWFYHPILTFFGLTLASFKVGGAVIIGRTGLVMLDRGAADAIKLEDLEESNLTRRSAHRFRETIVPFVIPILAGPGAICTVILYASYAENSTDKIWGTGIILSVMLLTFLTLAFAKKICQILGSTTLLIITRLFGFILIVLAAQMVLEGLGEVFPSWLGEHSPIEEEVRKAQKNEPKS